MGCICMSPRLGLQARCFQFCSSAIGLGRQWKMAPVLGSLPSTGEPWTGLQAAGFSMAQPGCCRLLGRDPADGPSADFLCLSNKMKKIQKEGWGEGGLPAQGLGCL